LVKLPIDAGLVTLRRWTPEDQEALAAEANSHAVWRNLTHVFPHPYTAADAASWIERCMDQDPPQDLVVACEDRLIGVCGMGRGEGVGRYTAEVGYWLGERHWGRGVMTVALEAFLGYVWETFDVQRLQATVFAWNPASARVLEENGFTLEGVHRRAIYKDGEFVDLLMFSRLRSEVR
jgi:RimJ/RimL family protein N-acetyltransferase